jgi:breast cancer 2 susceptibility protein
MVKSCTNKTDVLYVEGSIADVEKRAADATSQLELMCGGCLRQKHGPHATMSSMSRGDWIAQREPTYAMADSPAPVPPLAASSGAGGGLSARKGATADASDSRGDGASSFDDSSEDPPGRGDGSRTTLASNSVCIPASDGSDSDDERRAARLPARVSTRSPAQLAAPDGAMPPLSASGFECSQFDYGVESSQDAAPESTNAAAPQQWAMRAKQPSRAASKPAASAHKLAVEGAAPLPPPPPPPPPPPRSAPGVRSATRAASAAFSGFSTAGGTEAHISEGRLAEAMSLLGEDAASSSVLPDAALRQPAGSAVAAEAPVPPRVRSASPRPERARGVGGGGTFAGFSTARGDKVVLSVTSIAEAEMLLTTAVSAEEALPEQEATNHTTTVGATGPAAAAPPSKFAGFSTGRGTKVQLSAASIAVAKSLLTGDAPVAGGVAAASATDACVSGAVRSSRSARDASAAPVAVSAAASGAARAAPAAPAFAGFATGGGTKITLSSQHLEAAGKVLALPPACSSAIAGDGAVASKAAPEPEAPAFAGFATGGGTKVTLSSQHLEAAGKVLALSPTRSSAIAGDGAVAARAAPAAPAFAGFATGGGTKITLSSQHLEAAGKVLSKGEDNGDARGNASLSELVLQGARTPTHQRSPAVGAVDPNSQRARVSAHAAVLGEARGGAAKGEALGSRASSTARTAPSAATQRGPRDVRASLSSDDAARIVFSGGTEGVVLSELAPEDTHVAGSCAHGRGWLAAHNALVSRSEVDGRLVESAWTRNHYRWIVWKLAAQDRQKPPVGGRVGGARLSFSNVLKQLQHRYEKELNLARRPALRMVLEGDAPYSRYMVLCVSAVRSVPASGSAESATVGAHVELSDGWYCVDAALDAHLTQLLVANKIAVGDKLRVCAGGLDGAGSGIAPLECAANNAALRPSGARPMMRLHANATRRAYATARLGFQPTTSFRVCLSSLVVGGGAAPMVEAVVTRCYHMRFREVLPCDVYVYRGEKDDERAEREHRATFERAYEKAIEQKRADLEQQLREPGLSEAERDQINRDTMEEAADEAQSAMVAAAGGGQPALSRGGGRRAKSGQRDVSCSFEMRIACCCGGRTRANKRRCVRGDALFTRYDGQNAAHDVREGQRVLLTNADVSRRARRGDGGLIGMSMRDGKRSRMLRPCALALKKAAYTPRFWSQMRPPNASTPDFGDIDIVAVVVHATPCALQRGSQCKVTLFCMNERCATLAIGVEFDSLEANAPPHACEAGAPAAETRLPHPLRTVVAAGSIVAFRDVAVRSSDERLGVYCCEWTRRSSAVLLCAPAMVAAEERRPAMLAPPPAAAAAAAAAAAGALSAAGKRARAGGAGTPAPSARSSASRQRRRSRNRLTPLTRTKSRSAQMSVQKAPSALAAPLARWLHGRDGQISFAAEQARVREILEGGSAASSPNPERVRQQQVQDGEVSSLLIGLTSDDFGSASQDLSASSSALFAGLDLAAFDNPSQDLSQDRSFSVSRA